MRLCFAFFILIALGVCLQSALIAAANQRMSRLELARQDSAEIVAVLGLSDLCIATDARYIRHLAVSDRVAPFMDHPGGIEYFPTGSFWIPEP